MHKKIFFLLCIGIVCLFLSCLAIDYDYDLFARLIVGEQFVEQGIIHFNDFLSYTPTHPWYDHEWGSGVIFYLFLKYLGAFGLILLQAILFFGITFFIIKTQKLQKKAYPSSLLFLTIFLILFWKQNPTLIRCQSFSFLFFSMFLYMLEKYKKTNSNIILFIPLIVIIWNNLHGGVVSGLGLILIYLICLLIEQKPWKKLGAVLAISCPLLIINPYGVEYLKFLFSAATMNRKYITEWWHFLAYRHVLYYLPMSLYGIYGFILTLIKTYKTREYNYTKLIVLIVTLFEGLLHVKLLSLTLIAVAALCHNEIYDSVKLIKKYLKKFEKCLYISILIIAVTIPLYSPTNPRIEKDKYPICEIEFLKINNIKGNILTPFGLGSYVSYKLYPSNLIYMDGRYEEVYNDTEFLKLRDFKLGESNWKEVLNNYPTEIILATNNSISYNLLNNDNNWVLVFQGRLCGIFLKKENVKTNYIEPSYDINYYKKNAFNGYFGTKIRTMKK